MERYENGGNVLIVDEVMDDIVYYRTWINGGYNGAWRKETEEFELLLKEWLGEVK